MGQTAHHREFDAARLRLKGDLDAVRRTLGRRSLAAFGRLYFPHLFKLPDSDLHRDLYGLLETTPAQRGQRLAIAAPRGSAKSTVVSGVYLLWSLCHATEQYIVILSATADQAAGFLDLVKDELATNHQLREDFPEVCEPLGRKPRPERWRKDEIITRTGIRISALGAGQRLRGRKHGPDRPTLIVLDDIEHVNNTETPEVRRKLDRWFRRTVLRCGTSTTNIIMVGTIQHYDALLAKVVDPKQFPTWRGCVYRSIVRWSPAKELWETWTNLFHGRGEWADHTGPAAAKAFCAQHREAMLADTEVLWPVAEPYEYLMEMREGDGHLSFDAEMQNEPVNPAECLFQPEDIVYWDQAWPNEGALFAAIGDHARIVGACDPSLGKSGSDYSAIITLLQDTRTRQLYVLDADIRRRLPNQTIEDIIAHHQHRRYDRFVVESNGFQELMVNQLQDRARKAGQSLPIRMVTHQRDKRARIQNLHPHVHSGALQFNTHHHELLEQLRFYPKASHDDGPDALEMAATLAISRPPLEVA